MSQMRKIGILDLFEIKTSAKRWYVTIPRKIVEAYGLLPGDTLKIEILEVRKKPRGEEDEVRA